MATWELNCQSMLSSAGDKELAPYLARQKAMREFFERALFVPQDQDALRTRTTTACTFWAPRRARAKTTRPSRSRPT